MRYAEIIKNKKLSSFTEMRSYVISNALTDGKVVKDIKQKKTSENGNLIGY